MLRIYGINSSRDTANKKFELHVLDSFFADSIASPGKHYPNLVNVSLEVRDARSIALLKKGLQVFLRKLPIPKCCCWRYEAMRRHRCP